MHPPHLPARAIAPLPSASATECDSSTETAASKDTSPPPSYPETRCSLQTVRPLTQERYCRSQPSALVLRDQTWHRESSRPTLSPPDVPEVLRARRTYPTASF